MLSVPYSHIKGLASNKAKMLWWRLIFSALGEPHNHKTTLPDTLLCLCLSSHRRAWITPTVAPHAFPSVLNPTSRTLQCQGWQQTKRKSGPCSMSLFSEQWGFKSHMPCSIVSCGWIHCCPGLGHYGLLFFCHSSCSESQYFSGVRKVENLTVSIWSFCISRQTSKCGRM